MEEKKILIDPYIEPTDELIYSIIGDKQLLWKDVIAYLYENYDNITEVWRFYKDGNSWLFRTLQKKKTIFWLSVWEGYFKIGFYFAKSTEPKIMSGNFAEEAVIAYQEGRKIGNSREVAVDMHTKADVELVKKIIDMRIALK